MEKLFVSFLIFINSFVLVSVLHGADAVYIITTDGDTIYGLIENKKEIILSNSIDFRSNEFPDSIVALGPNSIIGFTILKKNQVYQSVQYRSNVNDEKNDVRRFGKLIYNNEVLLYKIAVPHEETNYTYESRDSYAYILKIDTAYYTLSQREIIIQKESDGPIQLFPNSMIKGQQIQTIETYSILKKDYIYSLRYLLRNCQKGLHAVNNLGFYDKAMILFISEYEICLYNQD